MLVFWSIVIGLFGLMIGSFLNAVLWRLKVRKSFLRGRSMCPRCRRTLKPVELIPLVSFILLRGRCRRCHKPISWWYPGIELMTALLFLASWLRFGATGPFFVDLAVFPFLILIFAYDARESLILDRVSLPGAGIALIGSLLLGLSFWNLILSAILGAGFFAVQYFFSNGRWVGGGDIRLGLLMGLFLGWPSVLLALCLAYIGGSVVGIALIATRRKKWQSAMPFGTYLTVATVLIHLYGYRILYYFS
jgi:prepilin signal peptidase PulO-like enzyme (type II secretory pathway)